MFRFAFSGIFITHMTLKHIPFCHLIGILAVVDDEPSWCTTTELAADEGNSFLFVNNFVWSINGHKSFVRCPLITITVDDADDWDDDDKGWSICNSANDDCDGVPTTAFWKLVKKTDRVRFIDKKKDNFVINIIVDNFIIIFFGLTNLNFKTKIVFPESTHTLTHTDKIHRSLLLL